ncbi:hypothetical protein RSAG8_13287, partial [Rhizoctonia solani AG-8 WAC10335]
MSTLDKYKHRRAELIASERALRFDAEAIANATDNERRAVEIVGALRAKEAREIWNTDTEKLMYPGMEFLTAKDTILSTKLFEVVKKMPKGSLLHLHMEGMGDAKFLLQTALEYPNTHSDPFGHHIRLASASSTTIPDLSLSIWSWVPLHKARSEFAYGGPEAFDKWVVGTMTINPKEAYVECNTSTKIWEKFGTTFGVAGSMIRYEPIMKRYWHQSSSNAVFDRRWHLVRVGFREDGSETPEHRDYLIWLGEAIQEVRDHMKAENREDEFAGAKIIYTTVRFRDNEDLMWYLEDCMTLKKEFPGLVAGFDLMGQEDTNNPFIYHAKSLLWFQEECKKRGLDIPFVFHAGETLDDGGAADSNLYDALLLGTKRIAPDLFSLAKHPLLMQMCKERGVALEVCPISNEILRMTSSMPMHPLPILLNHGVSVALCSDNPSVFGNMGLSFDFFQVIVASEVTNLLSLKQLAQQSLEHSLLDVEDKGRAIESWEKRWNAYIEEIISPKTFLN